MTDLCSDSPRFGSYISIKVSRAYALNNAKRIVTIQRIFNRTQMTPIGRI